MNKKNNEELKEKKNGILIGILILLIIILLGVILYIEKDKIMDLFNHNENEVIKDENGNVIEIVYNSLTKEDTTNYKNTETFYKQNNEFCVYDEDDCTSQDKVEIKVENKDIDILDYYKGKYLFYRDNNKIKVYNDETKLSYIINISSKFYSYIFGVDSVTDEFVGIVYHESEKDNPSYFSITENKVLYNRKYEYLEFLSKKYNCR